MKLNQFICSQYLIKCLYFAQFCRYAQEVGKSNWYESKWNGMECWMCARAEGRTTCKNVRILAIGSPCAHN